MADSKNERRIQVTKWWRAKVTWSTPSANAGGTRQRGSKAARQAGPIDKGPMPVATSLDKIKSL